MAIILDRVDAVPLNADDFSFEFKAWLSVLTDSLNAMIQQLEDYINLPYAPSYTTAEINTIAALTTTQNGTFFYDTDTNQLKAKVNGLPVVIV